MKISYKSVTIILPAMDETYSFEQTVNVILETCKFEEIEEIIVVVCKKTTKQCLESINRSKDIVEDRGISFKILWQKRPYAGGAVQDAIDISQGSHLIMMSSDLETDPNTVVDLIKSAKENPNEITTASRWMNGCQFEGYSKVKLVCNFVFQKIFSLFYHTKLTDMTYGYRIFPTYIMKAINWEEMKHPFYLETALKPIMLGVNIREIPTTWKARSEGESQNSFLQTFAYLKIAIRARFYSKDKIIKENYKVKLYEYYGTRNK